MRRVLVSLVLAAAVGAGVGPGRAANAAQTALPVASGRVIVKLRANATLLRDHAVVRGQTAQTVSVQAQRRADALGGRLGMRLGTGRMLNERTQVLTSSTLDSAALAARLSKQPDVEYAIEDRRQRIHALPNDPLFAAGPANGQGPDVGQWYLRTPNATLRSATNVEGAWSLVTPDPTLVVAVLDTGVLADHVDLAGRVLPGYDMVIDRDTANDGNGRDADASDPGDWTARNECDTGTAASASSWHGTKVSGIIGASSNNGIGMAGIASGVRILPVRVLGKCGGFVSDIVAGMYWAAGISQPGVPTNPTPARVLNLSLGGDGTCPRAYADAVAAVSAAPYNAVVVASAGNSSGLAVGNPANCAGVVAVGGLRHAGSKVGFSDLGPEVTITAPAGNCVNTATGTPCLYPILTSGNSGTQAPLAGGSIWTDSYKFSVGTSFSAPIVSGIVALMLSARPSLSPAAVIDALRSSAQPFPTSGAGTDTDGTPVKACHAPDGITEQLQCYCSTAWCGAGMVDAAAAVLSVIQAVPLAVAAEQLLDFGEARFPQYFPKNAAQPAVTQTFAPFRYRYYPGTGAYLGVVVDSDSQHTLNGVYVEGGPFGPRTYIGQVEQFITPTTTQAARRAP